MSVCSFALEAMTDSDMGAVVGRNSIVINTTPNNNQQKQNSFGSLSQIPNPKNIQPDFLFSYLSQFLPIEYTVVENGVVDNSTITPSNGNSTIVQLHETIAQLALLDIKAVGTTQSYGSIGFANISLNGKMILSTTH